MFGERWWIHKTPFQLGVKENERMKGALLDFGQQIPSRIENWRKVVGELIPESEYLSQFTLHSENQIIE